MTGPLVGVLERFLPCSQAREQGPGMPRHAAYGMEVSAQDNRCNKFDGTVEGGGGCSLAEGQ